MKKILSLVILLILSLQCLDEHSAIKSFGIKESMSTSSTEVTDLTNIIRFPIERIKYKGCVAAGLLWNNGDTGSVETFDTYVDLVVNSPCEHLSRVVETWASVPNFTLVKQRLDKLKSAGKKKGKSFTYGVFVAEAIDFTVNKFGFNFATMCQTGSQGQWGTNTCVPNMANSDYQNYLKYLVSESIKIGITDFLFGQLGYQDSTGIAPSLFKQLRKLGSNQGVAITIGGQPNANGSKRLSSYWESFDYIVGPSHLNLSPKHKSVPFDKALLAEGRVAVWQKPWLGQLHYSVISELDWSSIEDDIHKFTEMDRDARALFLSTTACEMKKRGAGYFMPFRIPLNGGSPRNGCFGHNQWVYSAGKGCNDQEAIAKYLKGQSCNIETLEDTIRMVFGLVFDEATMSQETLYDHFNKKIKNNRHNAHALILSLVGSEKFLKKHKAKSNRDYMIFIYTRFLHRKPDSNGLTYYVKKLGSGASRATVAKELIKSDEFLKHEKNKVFVSVW